METHSQVAASSKAPVVMNAVYLFAGCVRTSSPNPALQFFAANSNTDIHHCTCRCIACLATQHERASHPDVAQAAMNSINLGFDIGVNTDVGPSLLRSDLLQHSKDKLSLFMGSLNLWAIGGAFLASLLADHLGRRRSFAVASVGFLVGVVCMASAQSFTQLMLGRIVVGLGCGFGFAVDPVYISEISPPHARGRLVTWSEIGTNIGILVGWCAGYVLKDLDGDQSWRAMLGTGCVLPVVMLFLVKFVMPESPRWLIRMGRILEAKEILVQLYPPGEDIDAVVLTIQNNIAVETRESGSVTWRQMFHPNPALKRMLVVGIGVAVCQQLVGIDAIQYVLLPTRVIQFVPPLANAAAHEIFTPRSLWNVGIFCSLSWLKVVFARASGNFATSL